MLAQSITLGLLLQLFLIGHSIANRYIEESQYLHHFIKQVHQERPVETILLLRRKQQFSCVLNHLNPSGIPTLRFEETRQIVFTERFNSEVLAVLCLRQFEELVYLKILADNLHRIRETRIIIWIYDLQVDLGAYLSRIAEQAEKFGLLKMLVLHATSFDKLSINAYRLQPFPQASLERFDLSAYRRIFTKTWRDYRQKEATSQPSFHMLGSFLGRDWSRGESYLAGYMDRLIQEFARKHNIKLRLKTALNESVWISDRSLKEMLDKHELDLPMYARFIDLELEFTDYVDIGKLFIVVPCGREMRLGDVYRGMCNYFLIMLGAYFGFAVLEQIFWKIGRADHTWSYVDCFVNLRALAGALGLPSGLLRLYRTLSLRQLLMIMCLFSLVVSCFLSANLSAFLTKLPSYEHIENFDQLKKSGLSVIFDESAACSIEWLANHNEIGHLPNKLLLPNKERNRLMFALETNHGYQTFSRLWEIVDKYQRRFKRNAYCFSTGLIILYDLPIIGLLPQNSIYKQSLNAFILRSQEVGLITHWTNAAMRCLMATQIYTLHRNNTSSESEKMPLSNEDLLWVWKLLALAHGLAGLVFMGELLLKRRETTRQRTNTIKI